MPKKKGAKPKVRKTGAKPKVRKTVKKTANFDYSWLPKAAEETREQLATYDPTKDPLLRLRWHGKYWIRLLPMRSEAEYRNWIGYHWGVLPKNEDGYSEPIPCPSVNSNQPCPICDFLDEARATKKISNEDPLWKGTESIRVRRYLILRGLLVKFKAEDTKAPVFKDLPVMKAIAFPRMVAGKINEMLIDDDLGVDALLDMDDGMVIRVDYSEGIQWYWDITTVPKSWPIPEEFRDPDVWDEIDLSEFVPKVTTDDVLAVLEKHQRVIDERLVNHVLSIDAGGSELRLVSGGEENEEDFGDEDLEDSEDSGDDEFDEEPGEDEGDAGLEEEEEFGDEDLDPDLAEELDNI